MSPEVQEIDLIDKRGDIVCHLLRGTRPGYTWCGLDTSTRQSQRPAGNRHCKVCWMER